jgi:hypothetical protein
MTENATPLSKIIVALAGLTKLSALEKRGVTEDYVRREPVMQAVLVIRDAAYELAAAQQEVAALKVDAERYRALRSCRHQVCAGLYMPDSGTQWVDEGDLAAAPAPEPAAKSLAQKERDRQYHMDAINRLASFLGFHGTSFEVVQAAIDNITRLAKREPVYTTVTSIIDGRCKDKDCPYFGQNKASSCRCILGFIGDYRK